MKENIISSYQEHETIKRIEKIFKAAPIRRIDGSEKFIVFSDLHIGAKRRGDDFRANADLFLKALDEYYWPRGYTLILNGDIEELQKFNMPVIRRRWGKVFELLERFYSANRLIKIIGNHDLELSTGRYNSINSGLLEALRLEFEGQTIFLLHGHQAADIFHRYNDFVGYLVKYIASPLGIKNRTAAHNSKRKYTVERRIYRFSYLFKIVSIIGHTHRPLFEGLNKRDSLRFAIERILRDYPEMEEEEKNAAGDAIIKLKNEIESLEKKERSSTKSSFYHNADIVLPNLFNSGCVIGKRGMTGIEIRDKKIALIHWFDESKRKRYLRGAPSEPLPGSTFHRRIIKEDYLEYIFNRIRLLGWIEEKEEQGA